MSSVLCDQPTPNGLCQRPVSAPGAHCGVTHTEAVSPLGPTPAPPVPSSPLDPFGVDPDRPAAEPRQPARELFASVREELEWVKARRERDVRYAKKEDENQSPSPASDPLQQTFGESVEKRVTDAAPELGSATVASIATGSPVPVAGVVAGVGAGVAADHLGAGPRRRRRGLKARKRKIAQISEDANNASPAKRAMVAQKATAEVRLYELHFDSDPYVRQRVAYNENTPGYALTLLAGDKPPEVREEVAYNPAAPPKTLETLAADADERVRLGVARNSSTKTRVLENLVGDEDEPAPLGSWDADVRDAADRQLRARSVGMYDINSGKRLDVARNPETPRQALAVLAADADSDEVRQAVVQNPSTATQVIRDRAKNDPNPRIRAQAQERLREP